MAIQRSTFSNLLQAQKAMRRIFMDEWKEIPPEYPMFFNVKSSDRAYETEFLAAGFNLPPRTAELEALTYDDPQPVAEVRYQHIKFMLGFRVSFEFIRDEKFGFVAKLPRNLARVFRYRPEVEAAAVFNNGFAAYTNGTWGTVPIGTGSPNFPVGYTTAGVTFDGLSLFNTAHAIKRGGTYSNTSTLDLSFTGLVSANNSIQGTVDEAGLLIAARMSILAVPYQLEFRADEIIKSDKKPFTTNNEINALKTRGINPVVWHFLGTSSATRWYVIGEKSLTGLNFFWRDRTEFEQANDFDTKSIKNSALQRFSVGASDWRFTYGGNA